MEIARITQGKTTLVIEVDKRSQYYLSESGDIKQVDDDYIRRTLYYLHEAKKKGVFIERFTAISDKQRDNIIQSDNRWLMRQTTINNGKASLFTMLSNKGY